MHLSDLQIGQKAKVSGFVKDKLDRAYRQKLLSMGLTPGVEFHVLRVAPMGDPVEIQLRGFSLSLRKDEACALEISLCA